MPLYEFCCRRCGHIFEKVTPIDSPPPSCPKCNGETYRLISAVLFKIDNKEAVRRIEKRYESYIKDGKYRDAARFLDKASEFVKDDKIKRLREKAEKNLSKHGKRT